MFDLCELDAVVDGLEILGGVFTTENTEGTKNQQQLFVASERVSGTCDDI